MTLGNLLSLSEFSFFVHKVGMILALIREDLIRRVPKSLAVVVITTHQMSTDVRSARKLKGHLEGEGAVAHRGGLTRLGHTGNVCFLSTPAHDVVFQRPKRSSLPYPVGSEKVPHLDLKCLDLGFLKGDVLGCPCQHHTCYQEPICS